jgi:hypothetical protein
MLAKMPGKIWNGSLRCDFSQKHRGQKVGIASCPRFFAEIRTDEVGAISTFHRPGANVPQRVSTDGALTAIRTAFCTLFDVTAVVVRTDVGLDGGPAHRSFLS